MVTFNFLTHWTGNQKSVFNFLRNCWTVFCSRYTILNTCYSLSVFTIAFLLGYDVVFHYSVTYFQLSFYLSDYRLYLLVCWFGRWGSRYITTSSEAHLLFFSSLSSHSTISSIRVRPEFIIRTISVFAPEPLYKLSHFLFLDFPYIDNY
jgi:hypothetical protein